MHRLLDEYLSQVASELRTVPQRRRAEELREMQQHLLNAITVNQELMGQDEERAVATAIADFGEPHELASEILSAWRRGERNQNRRGLIGIILCLIVCRLIEGLLFIYFLRSIDAAPHINQSAYLSTYILLWNSISAASTGMITGLLFPKRAVTGIWIVTAIFQVITLIEFPFLHLQDFMREYFLATLQAMETTIATAFWAWLVVRWRTGRQYKIAR